ncbi:hypothetical protein [Fodinibius sediminis]|uniref:Uncharacterized protein n=1 Tax=Fodinibius sediminis TaxID=1214077 RepID=A0A521BYA0_9BACT|nr:hypothetical protein [Fodinibius sediminis]SMO51460.1 hypothetical protein SAMN06265218_104100 [Fodinibius sediminis]
MGALGGTLLYWGSIQFWDTGTINIPELLFTPAPWIVASVCSIGLSFWNILFPNNDQSIMES